MPQSPVRQTPSTAGFVPVAERLVEQSPLLQPAAQDRLWVKDCPSQTVATPGDHRLLPQTTQRFVPVAVRLVEQSPVLQPAAQDRL